MSIFDIFRRKKSSRVDSENDSYHKWMEIQNKLRENAEDADQLSTGYGEFGLCVTNPIPTMSIQESSRYLACLRTSDNELIDANRLGSTRAPEDVTNSIIDMYEISVHGEVRANLYICPYHKRTSKLAPRGFLLLGD